MTTKEKILIAASSEFAEKGFHRATIRDICESAEVNVASVNYHFSSKDILYEKVFEFLLEKSDEQNNPTRLKLNFKNEEEWWDEVRNLLYRLMRQSTSDYKYDRYLHTLFAMEELYPTENFSTIFLRLIAPRLKDIKTLFSYSNIETEEELNICVISIISIIMNFAERKALIGKITGDVNFGADNLELIVENIFAGIKTNIKFKGLKSEK